MEHQLLLIERMILESLMTEGKTLKCLAEDTGLSEEIIMSVLSHFISFGFVRFNGNIYSLNTSKKQDFMTTLNRKDAIKYEVKDIFSSLVNQYFQEEKMETLNLQKVYVTTGEEERIQRLLAHLNDYIKSIKNRPKRKNQIKNKKVILWGFSNYGEIVEESLRSVG